MDNYGGARVVLVLDKLLQLLLQLGRALEQQRIVPLKVGRDRSAIGQFVKLRPGVAHQRNQLGFVNLLRD
jgi:hypothetical protein